MGSVSGVIREKVACCVVVGAVSRTLRPWLWTGSGAVAYAIAPTTTTVVIIVGVGGRRCCIRRLCVSHTPQGSCPIPLERRGIGRNP